MATTKERKRSPLDCIPSVDAVRQRLEAVLKEARKLRILLRTAKEIEQTEPREGQSRE
jgi:hypothetical protein